LSAEKISEALISAGIPPELVIVIIAALPIIELRGAIPFGINLLGMPWYTVLPLAILGNMLPVPLILIFIEFVAGWLSRMPVFDKFFNWLFERTRRNSGIIEKYKRIGLAFENKKELDEYLDLLEEAAKRDHRKLGKELDLFGIYDEGGPGLVCWHPNGAMIRRVIEDFWKLEHDKRGYSLLYTPHIAKLDLWKKSGHWDYYRENLYSPMAIDEDEYLLKPMNCLYHIMIFNSRRRSYRELPLRYAELGTVYRYEPSGTLHGLSRVRGFTQDDSHIFCRYSQLEDEVTNVLDLAMFMIKTFGFDRYQVKLSTRPEKFTGTEQMWEHATSTLQKALEKKGIAYQVDPGEGVFYGPKIDIKFEDAMKRAWQGPTIQVDFNNPQRFNVTYTGEDGQEQPVAMVHRTVLGSMERFMACLIEHFGGAFPLWLAPVQVMVLPVADRHIEYANTVAQELRNNLIRVEVDTSSSTVNHKIRDAQMKKVPCMLILGDKELQAGNISVRWRDGKQDNGIAVSALLDSLIDSIRDKVL
jgi:threonyl-tRNA synthetase